jgi:hypothetical protein
LADGGFGRSVDDFPPVETRAALNTPPGLPETWVGPGGENAKRMGDAISMSAPFLKAGGNFAQRNRRFTLSMEISRLPAC